MKCEELVRFVVLAMTMTSQECALLVNSSIVLIPSPPATVTNGFHKSLAISRLTLHTAGIQDAWVKHRLFWLSGDQPHCSLFLPTSGSAKAGHDWIYINPIQVFVWPNSTQPSEEIGVMATTRGSGPSGTAPTGSSGIKVIVVGCGLGGLSAVIECQRKGHTVIAVDQQPVLRPIGMLVSILVWKC